MKKKLRLIVVDGRKYLWRFSPGYVATGAPASPWQCRDQFTAYLFQNKACPLRVYFLTWEDPVAGGPLRAGLPLHLPDLHSGQTTGLNLHTPEQAARLIRRALAAGWQPTPCHTPFVIREGVQWLLSGDDRRSPLSPPLLQATEGDTGELA